MKTTKSSRPELKSSLPLQSGYWSALAWSVALYIGSGALTAVVYRMQKSGSDTFDQLS